MESEYIALSNTCKDLFPLVDLIQELGGCVGLDINKTTNLHTCIYEDNEGALFLGKLKPHWMMLQSKHCALKYHWFREYLGPCNINLVKIKPSKQLGDIFTKGLIRIKFEYLQKKLMGW